MAKKINVPILSVYDNKGNRIPIPMAQGKTPEKGVDYFTEADKKEIIDELDKGKTQADWNQSDLTQPDYIKNRIGYLKKTIEILPKKKYAFSFDESFGTYSTSYVQTDISGFETKVVWGADSYNLNEEYWLNESGTISIVIGNMGVLNRPPEVKPNDNVPFLITIYYLPNKSLIEIKTSDKTIFDKRVKIIKNDTVIFDKNCHFENGNAMDLRGINFKYTPDDTFFSISVQDDTFEDGARYASNLIGVGNFNIINPSMPDTKAPVLFMILPRSPTPDSLYGYTIVVQAREDFSEKEIGLSVTSVKHIEDKFTHHIPGRRNPQLYSETFNSKFNIAEGQYSHSEGLGTIASGNMSHVQGKYNVNDASGDYAHIVGNGIDESERSNAHTLSWDGESWYSGSVLVGGNDANSALAKLTPTSVIITSSTPKSNKKFEITVDDAGNISAKEVV